MSIGADDLIQNTYRKNKIKNSYTCFEFDHGINRIICMHEVA